MLNQSDNRKEEVEKTYIPRSDVGPATSVTATSQVASPLPLETQESQNTRILKNVPCVEDNKSAGQSSDHEFSGSFMLSSISPAPITAPGKMPVKKENVYCSSRKVCVSGLSSSRWSKRGTGEQNRKKRTKRRDCSSSDLLPTGVESYMGVMYYFLFSFIFYLWEYSVGCLVVYALLWCVYILLILYLYIL